MHTSNTNTHNTSQYRYQLQYTHTTNYVTGTHTTHSTDYITGEPIHLLFYFTYSGTRNTYFHIFSL